MRSFLQKSPSISPMTRFRKDTPILNNSAIDEPTKPKKKRRRSSSSFTSFELERKRKELKNQHSIIEKRRRIKMNREFEALKFIVPACRATILDGINEGINNSESNSSAEKIYNLDNSNLMHKLTILQSTVEYIKYLHLIIKLMKLQMLIPKETRLLFNNWLKKNNHLQFANYDLDLQKYRNIDNNFDFNNLFITLSENNNDIPFEWIDPVTLEISKLANNLNSEIETPETPNTPATPDIEQENRIYRKSILQLQNDSNSFKLPMPAIIDKYPSTCTNTCTCTSMNTITNTSTATSTSTSAYTDKNRNTTKISQAQLLIRSNFLQANLSNYTLASDSTKTAETLVTGTNELDGPALLLSFKNNSDNSNRSVSSSPNTQPLSRHPSIPNMLN